MSDIIIEERPRMPEMARLFEQARRNLRWFSDHAEEVGIFKHYRGRFVAVSAGDFSSVRAGPK